MIYKVSNKIFSMHFWTRKAAEEFLKDNGTVGNGLHIVDIAVFGEFPYIVKDASPVKEVSPISV